MWKKKSIQWQVNKIKQKIKQKSSNAVIKSYSAQVILFFRRNHCMIINLTFYGCKEKISFCNSSKPSRSMEHQWTMGFSLIKVSNPYCMGFTNDKTCKMSMHVK